MKLTCLAAMIWLAALSAACGQSDWGTPDYFERKVGLKFTPVDPLIRCQQETGTNYVAFALVHLPPAAIDAIRQRPLSLSSLPAQRDDERERKIRHWAQGPLSAEAREALSLALGGGVGAVEKSHCAGILPQQVRDSVTASLARDTTLYAYQFKPVPGEPRVLPNALEFWVLDPAEGVLYELVNFS
jgi:hypothetical protein